MDARKQRSLQSILSAALELLSENEEATLVDVAKKANVGRATVYRQFENKEALVKVLALHCLDRMDEVNKDLEDQATSPMDGIRLLLKNTMPLTKEFLFLSQVESLCEKDPVLKAHIKRQDDELRALIHEAIEHNQIAEGFTVGWVFHLLEGLFWTGNQSVLSGETTVDEAAEFAFKTLKSGVGKTGWVREVLAGLGSE